MRDIDELEFFPLGCSSEAPPLTSPYTNIAILEEPVSCRGRVTGGFLCTALQGSTHVCTTGSVVLALSWGFGVKMDNLVSD